VKAGEDVALRLAHAAERQLSGNNIVEHHHSAEDLPIARLTAETREGIGYRIFEATLD